MSDLGSFVLGTTLYDYFTTTAAATGAPTVLAGTPVVSVYENDSDTQITAGITLGVDADSVVGLNRLTIVASAANGYEVGKQYFAVITTGTVGGTSAVGYKVSSFDIEKAGLNGSNVTLGAVGAVAALGIVDNGTLQSATGTTAVLRSAASFADDRLNGMTLVITGGTGVGQARIITDYVDSTDTATVDTWTTTPDNTSTYVVFGTPPAVTGGTLPAVNATQIGGQTASASGTITFPNATLASTTNISAGTITTATNVTTVNGLAANVITAAATAADFGTEIGAAVLTAAAANPIDANVQEINDVTITGNGAGTPFGV
jgi:hypothetical protein